MGFTFLKDTKEHCWYFEDMAQADAYGQIAIKILNNINSFKDKNTFAKINSVTLADSPYKQAMKDMGIADDSGTVRKDLLARFYENHENIDLPSPAAYEELETLKGCLAQAFSGELSSAEIAAIYDKYRYFPSVLTRNPDYSPGGIVLPSVVQFSGYQSFSDGRFFEVWEVDEYNDIFILDFYELLTSPHALRPKFCEICGSMFGSKSGKVKRCPICRNGQEFNRMVYNKRMSDKKSRLEKLILDYAYRTKKGEELKGKSAANAWTQQFIAERDRNKKTMTEEEYTKWLEMKFEEAKKKH